MKYLFLIVLFFLPSVSAASGEDELKPKELEEISVTATRTERTTKEIPAAIDTISREDIKNTRMFNLKEALAGISGVQSETKNGGYDSRLIIRGAGLKARYGVREIMILLDGVPITDPDGMSRLDFVDSQLVEKIDIVKGPNSTLYGANAAGGVINIITRNPFEERKSVTAGHGSDNSRMYNLNYGSSIKNTYFNISGSHRSTDSWRQWNTFSTDQASLKVGHLFTDNSTIEAAVSYTEADLRLPGALTKEQFEKDIRQLTAEQWRHSGRYSKIFSTNIKMEKETGSFTLKPLLYYQTWSHYHPVTGLINDGGADVYGADLQADMKHLIAGMEGTLTTGLTGQVDKGDGEKYTYRDYLKVPGPSGRIKNTLSDKKGDLAETGSDTTTKWGVFVQESLRPSGKWIVDLGVRYDQVAFDINTKTYWEYSYSKGKYLLSTETIKRDETFDSISPRLGVVYSLNKIVNLYGNISTGFQTPQSSEMSANPDLKPLTVYNYETGMKARFTGGHSIDLSLFFMKVRDEIVQTVVGGESTYSNAGKSEKKGVEFTGKFQVMKGLFAGGTYTYSDFQFREFTEWISGTPYNRNGNRFPYIPEHQYSIFAYYNHPSGFKFKVNTDTWGEYYMDNANTEKYKGYKFLTNALIGYEKKNLDITLDAYNIFDKRYAMEVTKDSTKSDPYLYRPGAPFSLMARVTCRF
ncbi:MAG: TonB-dependent receptor [Nitrospirae bacterium]|nr:TonB-dependent receptor [Nitrospirota bacterium]